MQRKHLFDCQVLIWHYLEFFDTPAAAHSNYTLSPTLKEKKKRKEKYGK